LKRLIFAILVLALVLETMPAFGHRMFIGQRVTVDLYAIFDDGEPAKDASVQVSGMGSSTPRIRPTPQESSAWFCRKGDWRVEIHCVWRRTC